MSLVTTDISRIIFMSFTLLHRIEIAPEFGKPISYVTQDDMHRLLVENPNSDVFHYIEVPNMCN